MKSPRITVDIIIEIDNGIILIKRKNPPHGWAIPGGFVDYGESLESAAKREAKEETGLDVENLRQLHTYSEPGRDPRGHTVSTAFTAKGKGTPKASDDAAEIGIFTKDNLPENLAFDHRKILEDYFSFNKNHGVPPNKIGGQAQRHRENKEVSSIIVSSKNFFS